MQTRRNVARESKKTRLGLLRLDTEEHIDLQFVAEEAGDLQIPPPEKERHDRVREGRGHRLYSDLLFVLTHHYFPPERAERLWNTIQRHKQEMNRQLGRDVGIAVATMDYLSNFNRDLGSPTVIDESKISAVAEIATRDGMTGLYDHSSFQLALGKELQRYHRYGQSVSLLMLDLDRFKQYNDAHGHPAGDRILSEIGRFIEEQIRDLDIGARYGGEEFAVIAPSTDSKDAFALAERLRCRVANELSREGITVSIGVATCPDEASSSDELVRAADNALYRAKEEGRNRTSQSAKEVSHHGAEEDEHAST
jgi:diguanylate cyclase (GGDEF)-like protein